MPSILIVDDEKNIRNHLATYVAGLRHTVHIAADAAAALTAIERNAPDIVFSDVRMAGMDGLALLREIRHRRAETVVVLMTAYATVPQAVEAMRAGAYDYLVKPFSLEQVGLLLDRVLEVQTLRRDNRALRSAVEEPISLESASAAMQRQLTTARQAAASDVTVLLTGESGTGKNVLAAAIHAWSPRRHGPFVTVACTTLAEHLLESELFGHVKGAGRPQHPPDQPPPHRSVHRGELRRDSRGVDRKRAVRPRARRVHRRDRIEGRRLRNGARWDAVPR